MPATARRLAPVPRPAPAPRVRLPAPPLRGRLAPMGSRDTWLARAWRAMAPLYARAGATMPRPEVRISCGFPSRGALARKKARWGECWSPLAAADHRSQVWITPREGDPIEVLAVLVHEGVHVCVGTSAGHGPAFKALARALGLEGKLTATAAGPELRARLEKIARDLGPYPHAQITPAFSGLKRQANRWLKAQCEVASCPASGYTIRLTRQWVQVAGCPKCPGCDTVLTYERAERTEGAERPRRRATGR